MRARSPRIPSSHGEITTKQQPDGRWAARAQVRDIDGRIRSVRVKDSTKGGALRAIRQRLEKRVDPTIKGITPDTTYDTLAALWLQHRKDHGKVRTKGKLAPQTLATYNAEIEHVITPAIGKVRVGETNVPFLDRPFADVEHGRKHGNYQAREHGRSTRQLRVVLGGMISLAVAHGALAANPMRDASQSAREPKTEVEYLTVPHALHLRSRVRREAMRVDGRRMPNRDLEEFVDLLLGTGMREGEGLAIRPIDLSGLPTGPDHPGAERCEVSGEAIEETLPVLHVCGTLVEPRKGYVDKLHRQDMTKTREDRRLILPRPCRANAGRADAQTATRDPGVTDLRHPHRELDLPGQHAHPPPSGHRPGRGQLGHRDPSITYRHYVGKRPLAPDLRSTLDQFFEAVAEGEVP